LLDFYNSHSAREPPCTIISHQNFLQNVGMTMAVTVMVCNGFWRADCTHYTAVTFVLTCHWESVTWWWCYI